jgi:hypothetical protein
LLLGAVELLLKAAHTMEHVTEKRKSILDNVIDTLRDAGVFNEGVHRNIISQYFSRLCFSLKNINVNIYNILNSRSNTHI